MARVRILEQCELENLDDVNLTLADIGELQRKIEAIEAQMQADIDTAKAAAEVAAEPHRKRIAQLEAQIKMYADEHIDELGGKKTRTLTFGQIGYRRSTKVLLPKAAAKIEEIIRALRAHGMDDCVVAPAPKVDKDALKKYPATEITAVGAGLKVEDVFWYEVDRERLQAEGAK